MSKYTEGLHHQSVRKRIHQKHEQYPHPNKWKNLLDRIIYPIGILGPILTIPQFLEIWISKDASGLSLFTWSSWIVIAFFWVLYGLAHKELPIVISYIAWIVIEVGVVIGIVLYG